MRISLLLALVLSSTLCFPTEAQVYSRNIVGYINKVLYAGDNLIANQLANSNNTLNVIFNAGVPDGTTFTMWDAAAASYLPSSSYDTSSGWSINYELDYGQGGLFHTTSTFTNLFSGVVWPDFDQNNIVSPLVASDGLQLLSCFIPIGGATFYQIVGRNPLDGESVRTLDALAQIYSTTTFRNGSWDNGAPALGLGDAAFFNLSAVPEPAPLYLASIVVWAVLHGRRRSGS